MNVVAALGVFLVGFFFVSSIPINNFFKLFYFLLLTAL